MQQGAATLFVVREPHGIWREARGWRRLNPKERDVVVIVTGAKHVSSSTEKVKLSLFLIKHTYAIKT